jgi:AraC-like DNA-binding protein
MVRGVLLRRQRFELGQLDIARLVHGISHPRLWVHVVEHRGNIIDERIGRCLGHGRSSLGRRVVGVMLRGRAELRTLSASRWLGPGDLCVSDARGAFTSRHEALEESSLSITIEWDREYFGGPPIGEPLLDRLGSAAPVLLEVEALRRSIERAWLDTEANRAVASQLLRVLASLRAEGIDVPKLTEAELAGESAPDVERLSRALDTSLSFTGTRPMMVDLEDITLLSGRTVERTLPEMLRAWGQAPETFRELRSRVRLFQAQLLMSHPAVTTELASRVFGFASPNAFCRAFWKAGLPSPGRIREALGQLSCS